MRLPLLITSFLLIACANRNPDYIKPGKTNIAEVESTEGKPLEIKDSSFHKDKKIYHYNSFSLQVNNKVIEAIFREPKPVEKTLQHWRQLYKDSPSEFKRLERAGHEEFWQLDIPSAGLSIIYNKSANIVTKVVKHE